MGGILTEMNIEIFLIAFGLTMTPALIFYWIGARHGSAYWRGKAGVADDRAYHAQQQADFYQAQHDLATRKLAVLQRQFECLQKQIADQLLLRDPPPLRPGLGGQQPDPSKAALADGWMMVPDIPAGGVVQLDPGYLQNAINQQARNADQQSKQEKPDGKA